VNRENSRNHVTHLNQGEKKTLAFVLYFAFLTYFALNIDTFNRYKTPR